MTADRTRLTLLQLAVVLGVCGFLFFFAIGAFGLVGADEPRYAQIAREMFQRHDWRIPTFNGSPWLEKPVWLYWNAILSYRLFGVHDWAARLPAAFHATALVLAIFFFMRRFRAGSELDAAVITASSAAMIGFARGASTDMLLAAPFCIAMLAWWTWHQTERKLWLAAFYAMLAAGTLAKGPVAPALALIIVTAYAALRREGKILLRSLWWPGFVIFFALTLPWFVAIQMKVPEFFRVFFLEHNLQRFGTNLYQHSQPFWYYVPIFLVSVVPWVVFTLPALVEAAKALAGKLRRETLENDDGEGNRAAPGENSSAAGGDWLDIFLLLWIVIPILFFSISRSKLPGYILPVIPAAAVLTADYLHRRREIPRLQLMLHSLVCGVLVACALLTPWGMMREAIPDQVKTVIIVSTGVVAIGVLMVVRKRGLPVLHFATLVPVIVALVFLLRFAAIPENANYPVHGLIIDLTRSTRSVDGQLRRLGYPETPVAVFNVRRDVAYGLNFYRNHPVSYYEQGGPRDLPYGIPATEHVVVTRSGNGDAVQAAVGDRKVTSLGLFPPQQLEFFLVSGGK
jgi:4-amino-4-deoxy-L-arabinose transferase-like glycosyltransferase